MVPESRFDELRQRGRFAFSSCADRLVGGHVHVLGEEMNATISHNKLSATGVPTAGRFFGTTIDWIVAFSGNQELGHLCRRIGVRSGGKHGASIAARTESADRIATGVGNFADKNRVGQTIYHIGESSAAADIEYAVAIHAAPRLGQHILKRCNACTDTVIIAIANSSTHVAVVGASLIAVLLTAASNIRLRWAPKNRKRRLTNNQRLARVLISKFISHSVGALNSVVERRLFDEGQDAGVPGPSMAIEVIACCVG